jgi:hypothetical protein
MGINDESRHSGSETWDDANKDIERNNPIVDNFLKHIGKILGLTLSENFSRYPKLYI